MQGRSLPPGEGPKILSLKETMFFWPGWVAEYGNHPVSDAFTSKP